jgi:hypothetical protein
MKQVPRSQQSLSRAVHTELVSKSPHAHSHPHLGLEVLALNAEAQLVTWQAHAGAMPAAGPVAVAATAAGISKLNKPDERV